MRMNLQEFKQSQIKYNARFEKLYRQQRWIRYHRCFCGFDIETTAVNEMSFMYIWQFSFMLDDSECIVVKGRTWKEFDELIRFLKVRLCLRDNTRLIVWVANLGYEFSFMRKRLEIDELFAKTPRNPLLVRCGGLEFRECLSISQGSLSYLAKTWTATQKMVGDLDYSVIRNSQTPLLPDTEEKYCDNDVIILAEFSKKIFDNYIKKERYIPITSTGILRHDLKVYARASEKDPERIYKWIKALHPKSKAEYLYIMEWLFRGGFVHANYKMCDCILENMDSYDLKSSYPAVAFQEYYPISEFKPIENVSHETLERLCEKYCVIFQATFKGLKATTSHSIESKSKCIKLNKPLMDNGRVHNADSMTVFITELDYQSYKEFYTWDDMIIHTCHVANRGELPRYLLDRFYHWFNVKESITDKDSQEYAISKTRINGHFGLCVTRFVFSEVMYLDDEWTHGEVKQTYEQMTEKQVLSPYWGVYITAHARRRELSLLFKMRHAVAYSDTDSHKLKEDDICLKVISDFNAMIKQKNIDVCNKYGYDLNILSKIGILEKETDSKGKGIMLQFKTLGAKRYICNYANKGIECTISGLPKKALTDYCNAENKDIFEEFTNGLKVPSKYTNKLVSIYLDEPYKDTVIDDFGNVEVMRESSGIYLKPSDFNLSMDKEYLKLLEFWLERRKKHG